MAHVRDNLCPPLGKPVASCPFPGLDSVDSGIYESCLNASAQFGVKNDASDKRRLLI